MSVTQETKKTDNKVDLVSLIKESCELATSKGFHEAKRPEEELLMLIISEMGECLEAHRKNNFAQMDEYFAVINGKQNLVIEGELIDNLKFYDEDIEGIPNFRAKAFRQFVKDTVSDEMADIVIRLCDYSGVKKLNAEDIALDVETELLDMTTIRVENLGVYLLNITRTIIDIADNHDKDTYVSRAIAKMIHLCNEMNINLVQHIALKMEYNKSRPRLHGKAY